MAVKRIFDILFSTAVLMLGAIPLYLPIAAIIKFSGNGPIIFRQKRNGLNGKVFICYKFRTIVKDVPNRENIRENIENDHSSKLQYVPLGRFLRHTGLDELPQFFNVLKGDMSVVGPRPMMVEENEYFSQHLPGYTRRLEVKPGITGSAQVEGYKGKIMSVEFMEKRLEKDLRYVDNHSFMGDLKIIAKTIADIFR